eukprot:224891-Lingulodinium_polyedra.AAC.1
MAGDIESNPGPARPGGAALVPRDSDLIAEGSVSQASRYRRGVALQLFQLWLQTSLGIQFEALSGSGHLLGIALQGFTAYLFKAGAP